MIKGAIKLAQPQYKRINIALVANWDYVMPLETTIKSIAFHNNNFTIFLVNPDIPREWFNHVNRELAPLNGIVKDVKIRTDDLQNQHLSQPQINLMSNARLLLPRLLHCKRVLFMDSDIIVRKSLLGLFNTDLQGHALGAVQEADGERFNAGIMLLNLQKIQQDPQIVDKLLKYGERPDLENGDETVMNHFFFKDHLPLSPIYNMQVGLEKPWEIALAAGKPHAQENLDHQRELLKRLPDAVVVHYLTSVKPWATISYSRCRNLWWQYEKLSWSQVVDHQLPAKDSLDTSVLIWSDTDNLPQLEILLQKMPETTFILCTPETISTYLQNMIRYPNFRVFPLVRNQFLQRLIKECRVYLDLNAGNKNIDLLQQLIDRYCPVYSFKSVAMPDLIPYSNMHVFQDNQVDEFVHELSQELTSKSNTKEEN